MTMVARSEIVAQYLGRWCPCDLAFIDAIEYRGSTPEHSSQLRMIARFQRRDTSKHGWPDPDGPFIEVTISFSGVANLQLKAFGPMAKQITGFDIIDISDRGLEDIQYFVEDYEDDQISFYYTDAVIENVISISP